MSAPQATARTRTFQALKPACVHLSATALNVQAGKLGSTELLTALANLKKALSIASLPESGFDGKLAEYVFFPISHVFRARELVPVRALELALACLDTLLETGWSVINEPNLAVQLLILLSFLLTGKGSSPQDNEKTSEELQTTAFDCEARLFSSIKASSKCRDALLEQSNLPALGHAITVMLAGAKDGESATVQLAALSTFQAFQEWVSTREVSASFLPGIVSSFTVILTPTTQFRRSFKVITLALSTLADVVRLVLSDMYPVAPPRAESRTEEISGVAPPVLDTSWLKATAAQMKVALGNIVKLRKHDRFEVRNALQHLCTIVLEDCPEHLSDSRSLMLETLVLLSVTDESNGARESISSLINVDVNLAELLRDNVYSWIVSMPRVMLSNDDATKNNLVDRIGASLRLLSTSDVDLTVVNNALLSNVQDAVENMAENHNKPALEASKEAELDLSLSPLVAIDALDSPRFDIVLAGNTSEREMLQKFQNLVNELSTSKDSTAIVEDSIGQVRYREGSLRVVSFWLSLSIAKAKAAHESPLQQMVDLGEPLVDSGSDELYDFALSVLTQADDDFERDWRLQAVALEALAFHAQCLKQDFRIELVDALYPVVHLAGSRNIALQRHAITCLDIFASNCGYADAKDLLISNVDYLVNAVAMKLNAFDISPQTPQVLLMMARLCGPRLVPYLDDLVGNIFEALECFHGYPALVELLFTVLNVIVEEGVRAPALALDAPESSSESRIASNDRPTWQPTTMEEVAASLKARSVKSRIRESNRLDNDEDLPQTTPHRPWSEIKPKTQPATEDGERTSPSEDEIDVPSKGKYADKKLSKTYKTIHSITELTQHHLPSSSPSLRYSLLNLLHTAITYLAQHEDTFLPTINTLWPVLTPRLRDKEAYVVAATLEVMGSMCTGAGDFMRGRIQGVWPALRRLHEDVEAQLRGHSFRAVQKSSATIRPLGRDELLHAAEVTAAPALQGGTLPNRSSALSLAEGGAAYTPTTARTLQSALTGFVTSVVKHVPSMPAGMFAEALGVFLKRPLLEGNEMVREAVGERNGDALWLFLEKDKWAKAKSEGTVKLLKEKWRALKPTDDDEGRFRFVEVNLVD